MENNYHVHYELDSDQRLNALIYCSKFQQYVAEKYGKVLFFDTIVGTNKYNCVRGTVTIQLTNGRLVPVLHCIINHQDTLAFEKVFNIGLKEIIGLPKCLLTNQDKAISKAVDNIFKDQVYHVYCSRHAKENKEKHIACLVSPNSLRSFLLKIKFAYIQNCWDYLKKYQKKKLPETSIFFS